MWTLGQTAGSWIGRGQVTTPYGQWSGADLIPGGAENDTVLRADEWPCTFILCLVTEDLTHVDRGHHSADLKTTLGRKQSIS